MGQHMPAGPPRQPARPVQVDVGEAVDRLQEQGGALAGPSGRGHASTSTAVIFVAPFRSDIDGNRPSLGVLPIGMYLSGVKNKPAYGIESVDHALRLAVLLQQEGPLRLTDAAQRLGVARSTAHRLLAMLVYRDFAEQDEQRRYVAGPVVRSPEAPEPVADLRRVAVPHLMTIEFVLNMSLLKKIF